MTEHKFTVSPAEAGLRIDLYLTGQIAEFSRSRIQKLIKDGAVSVNGSLVKANYLAEEGDAVLVTVPETSPLQLAAEDIPFEILYEDSDLIVVNKPQGLVVHPAAGNWEGTLVNALLHHCGDLSGINGVVRPGIVHRIDKDTSGVLVVAKNDFAHAGLAKQLKEHSINRIYTALVHGTIPEPAGVIEAPIGRHPVQRKKMAVVTQNGKTAITHYRVLERIAGYTLIEAKLETGRTHQIRVHMSYLGHPLAGDPVYGPKKNTLGLAGQALHARTLGFVHPRSEVYMEFEAPLPEYFQDLLKKMHLPG